MSEEFIIRIAEHGLTGVRIEIGQIKIGAA